MFLKCITCDQNYEVPFDDKTYQIWIEINMNEGKGANTNWKYECPSCVGLDILKCDYLVITKIFSGHKFDIRLT